MKTLQDLQKRQMIFKDKGEQMTKQRAIDYLKFLHELEQNLKKDLFGLDKSELVEKIRLKFLENYQDKKGV